MQLPFEDGAFDAVVCQFGVMFFPDKAKAFAEARRVLRSGGLLMFNVWDRIEENEFADAVTTALAIPLPCRSAPLPRPHSARLLTTGRPSSGISPAAGSPPPQIHHRSGAQSGGIPARIPAIAYLPGNAAPKRDRGARPPRGSARRPTRAATPSLGGSGGARWTARSRRTWWASKSDGLQLIARDESALPSNARSA